jgi:hypothetical protein
MITPALAGTAQNAMNAKAHTVLATCLMFLPFPTGPWNHPEGMGEQTARKNGFRVIESG